MSNLIDIQTQIEKLQKQANDIKSKEFDRTVQEIVAKMQAFGITTKDLQSVRTTKGKAKATKTSAQRRDKAPKSGKGTVAPKYRGPNGETWSGRGLTPRWLSGLISQGKQKEDFAIQP